MPDFDEQRERMVTEQLEARGITSAPVLRAMRRVPRHCFVPREAAGEAYADRPLPIGNGQTISQPFIVGYMTSLLALAPTDRVLEVGTGSGYQTAILSLIAARVVTIERDPALSGRARATLARLGYGNVHFIDGDGSLGWGGEAPYDAILVTAGSPEVPGALRDQLADGGRLVCPVGTREHQQIKRITRQGSKLLTTAHTDCIFVPLTGKDGWPEAGA